MIEIFNNIRKLYKFATPRLELAAYVEFFSETSLTSTQQHIADTNFTVTLFPSYTPTIWINLGSPYYLKNGDTTHLISADTDVLVLRDKVIERNNLPTDNIFTIKFNPGGLEAILGIRQADISNSIVKASHVIPATVLQRLKAMDVFEERIALLENFFLTKMEERLKHNHYLKVVNDAIDAFCISNMASNNNVLAGNLYLTDKTLYRYFTNVIGTNPKTYFATVRARTALIAYIADKQTFSPYDFGYYDKSHFYKDVMRFTGQKLSSFQAS